MGTRVHEASYKLRKRGKPLPVQNLRANSRKPTCYNQWDPVIFLLFLKKGIGLYNIVQPDVLFVFTPSVDDHREYFYFGKEVYILMSILEYPLIT